MSGCIRACFRVSKLQRRAGIRGRGDYSSFTGENVIEESEISPRQNQLLAGLPLTIQASFFPHLKLEFLPFGKVLCESGQVLRQAYFPIDSIVALLNVTQGGSSTEISMVGNEGLVGASVLLGGERAITTVLVQNEGHAYSLSALRLRTEFNSDSEMRNHLLRYIQARFINMAQLAVCNRRHSVQQQLCRWLLSSLDRLHGNQLIVTQELIASLLGVRRPGVTEAASKLQELGVIEYKRGHLTVLDRSKLEKLSCECYAIVRTETDRIAAF